MEGENMKKHGIRLLFLAVFVLTFALCALVADAQRLSNELLRLHVVGASDAQADQALKLQVRDVLLKTLEQGLQDVTDADEAQAYVESMLPQLKETADRVLQEAGSTDTATVSVAWEEFPLREYETFRLPSGLYRSLRVTIGPGKGRNWWCVVFPELCNAATTEEFAEVAAMEGLPEPLNKSLTGEYEVRFWLLDQLGRLRNFLHRDSA